MKFDKLFIETNLPKPLEKEELNNYFEKMKLGDMTAREKIINHNIRLVMYEIKKFSNTSYDLSELVSIGLIGLIKSVDTFDMSKGLQFTTYSGRCIDNEILMFLRKNKKYTNNISLDQTIGKDKDDKELKVYDTLEDINSDFVKKYEDNESYKVIRNVINQLPERDKIIVMKHFGFINDKPMTQIEIANELGVTKSYISRVIKKVLKNVNVKLERLRIIDASRKNIINQEETQSESTQNQTSRDDVILKKMRRICTNGECKKF